MPGADTWHLASHLNLASGVSLKRALKMQVRNAYFRLLVHSSQKLCPKPDSGNFAPCILPCKIGGSQNLMKERYLSETPFLLFVYLSKCNIKLSGYFGNSKKRFLWTGLVRMLPRCFLWVMVTKVIMLIVMIIIRDKMVEDRQGRQDRQNSHYWQLNLTFQATCDWKLSQSLWCFYRTQVRS